VIGESAAVDWPPLIPPPPIAELADAQAVLRRRLVESGWVPVEGGESWYRHRFAWTGAEPPRDLGTPAADEQTVEPLPERTRPGSEPGPSAVVRADAPTRRELYDEARRLGIPGRSRMNKAELARAVARAQQ
jgi:hypothetical protein